MKVLFIALLTFSALVSYGQDTIKLVTHPADRFYGGCTEEVCGIYDTTYNHFEVHCYFKTTKKEAVKLYINGKKRMSTFQKVRKNSYAFYVMAEFKNAELVVGDKRYYFKL